MLIILVFTFLVFTYSPFSNRLVQSVITAPLLFCDAGMLICFYNPVKEEVSLDMKTLLSIAEVGLAMTLFTDAAHLNRNMFNTINIVNSPRVPERITRVTG